MRARSVSKPTENAAIANALLDQRMAWRIRRYGFACLTEREHEAMRIEIDLLRTTGQAGLTAISAKMRLTTNGRQPAHQNVSKYLAAAEWCMRYFDRHAIRAEWVRVGRRWELDAPTCGREWCE